MHVAGNPENSDTIVSVTNKNSTLDSFWLILPVRFVAMWQKDNVMDDRLEHKFEGKS